MTWGFHNGAIRFYEAGREIGSLDRHSMARMLEDIARAMQEHSDTGSDTNAITHS